MQRTDCLPSMFEVSWIDQFLKDFDRPRSSNVYDHSSTIAYLTFYFKQKLLVCEINSSIHSVDYYSENKEAKNFIE